MEHKLIKEFDCCGKRMVVIRCENAVHIMDLREWEFLINTIIFEGINSNKEKKCDE